ncbi:DUF1405 domain-containing protein [Effusibacillus lacus]|uniref:DUF1405 domain-containing protein n=1 Tax=Effusibacillus lacus TaxID=1348429 RepID=A0A292YT84_9BACL|nr:DUF1405 domain-containing protein [Effusibacillus lacus]TCS74975.1 putative membrane protein YpjA [Effusibacillus lacus]GAX91644.1 hypothetical protein EFBL_3334 [Effusibacillus lacus]
MRRLLEILTRPQILMTLIWVNGLGTLYGYYWYKDQLLTTPPIFLPLVPDSPTSSLFFTLFLILLWYNKRNPYIEAFGALLSVKYGFWAVGIIFFFGYLYGEIHWSSWMLVVSHFGMAIEAFLFLRFYTFKGKHLLAAGSWILFNDWVDYTFDVHPWLQSDEFDIPISWLTVLLSIIVISIFAFLRNRKSESNKFVGIKSETEYIP